MAADGKIVRARRRVQEVRGPLRRALAALSEVERYGLLEDADVFGRVTITEDPQTEKDLADLVGLAREDYPAQKLEVIIVIAGEDQQRGGTSEHVNE